jgi:poly-gamma-glutamate synthesis protein (capsule biosynthesis protein)
MNAKKTNYASRFTLCLMIAGTMLFSTAGHPAHAQAGGRFYAVAAPFPTVADGVSVKALQNFWLGNAEALISATNNGAEPTLFLTEETRNALLPILGAPGDNAKITVVAPQDLLGAVWNARPASLAILPFDQLEARWKLLQLDGVNLFNKQADTSRYPLAVDGPPNRDLNKLTVVAMTGVTALVRGTAVMMEKKGVLYPGAAIRDWLRTADIAHISNEVSFWDKCPPPTFNDGTTMCSNPKYIELLKDVGTDVIELTGNHLWDRGSDKLVGTLDTYDALGWPYFGGGRNAATALNPVKLNVNGNKIAFAGCNWFGSDWATDSQPGSARCGSKNPRDLDLIIQEIQQLRAEGYQVIAGIQYLELYDYAATPQQARDFNALREAGAVVVNGSQGHHAQGFSVNDKGFVHYGTGNLFFGDQAGPGAKTTFVDRHTFYDGKYLGADLRTAFIEDNSQPRPMNEKDRAALLRRLFGASGG